MSEPKIIKCVECGCELGTIYKAKLKTKTVYVCNTCYNGFPQEPKDVREDINPDKDDPTLDKLKDIFGMK